MDFEKIISGIDEKELHEMKKKRKKYWKHMKYSRGNKNEVKGSRFVRKESNLVCRRRR